MVSMRKRRMAEAHIDDAGTGVDGNVAIERANRHPEPDLADRYYGGSVLVAVNGRSSGWCALDWAAVEAATRRCSLRIVHVIAPPIVILDPMNGIATNWRNSTAEKRERVCSMRPSVARPRRP